MYVGLRSLEYVDCVFVPGYNSYPPGCSRTSISYSSDQCNQAHTLWYWMLIIILQSYYCKCIDWLVTYIISGIYNVLH
jgi:hypothetical protein